MKVRRSPRALARASAVALLVGCGWFAPTPVSAQPGSLIVTITAPSQGSTVGGTIAVSAAVTAVGSLTVSQVSFYLDGSLIGSDAAPPYAVSWDTRTASNGGHTLTAVARDSLGLNWHSDPVTVTVFNDTTPPAVSLGPPGQGAVIRGTISVTAEASDNVGVAGVQFLVDGSPLGAEDVSAPYEVSWDSATAPDGPHTLAARARDAAGNTTTSTPVAVTADNGPPAVAMSAPADGATVGGTVAVSASASDTVGVAGVQFFVDGNPSGAEDTSAPYEMAWHTATVSDGTHVLTARARDGAGNTATAPPITVTVSNAAGPSLVRLEEDNADVAYFDSWTHNYTGEPGGWSGGSVSFSVAQGARATLNFSGTGVSWIGYRASNTGIADVYLDGVLVATVDTYAPAATAQAALYTSPQLAPGSHTIAIEATRTKNEASSDFIVVVDAFDVAGAPGDTIAPSVSITAPASGATVSGSTTVSSSASDNVGVAGVQFLLDGAPLGSEITTAPYVLTWNTATAADGTHTLTARARDAAGNTTTSEPVTVAVQNTNPPPSQELTRFEEMEAAIVYTPGTTEPGRPADWWHGSRSRDWTLGTSSFNRSLGARATFTFTGTSVSWVGFRGPWCGIARVYVDGLFVAEVDLYAAQEQPQAVVFAAAGLSAGVHTIAVESTGRRNEAAEDYAVVVDAFDVSPAQPLPVTGTRVENTSPPVTFSGAWTPNEAEGTTVSADAASRASVSFAGTSIRWIGVRGPAHGIARVYLDGAFQATVDTYASRETRGVVYQVTNLAPGSHTLEVEVSGLKHADSAGGAVVVDAFDTRARLEDADAAVQYSGTWIAQDTVRAWSGTSLQTGAGTASRTQAAGARAEVTFSGTAISWIAMRAPWAGIADVFVDGVLTATVDLYSAAEDVRAAVFSATGLGAGTHTLAIEVTGTRNPAASSAFVVVDAFDVTLPEPVPPVRRLQETDEAIAYEAAADWVSPGTARLWSGERSKESTVAGARATLTFNGTAVRWIGERGFTTGVARISVDGAVVATVDTRAAMQAEYQVPLFAVSGLAPGSHTLTIEVVGRNGEPPGLPVERVTLDAFDVSQ